MANPADTKNPLPSGAEETPGETLARAREMVADKPANTMNAADLGQQPFKVAPVTPTTGYEGLIKTSEAAITDLEPEVTKGREDIESAYDRIGDVRRSRSEGYEDEGVYDKRLAYKNAVNTINQKELAFQAKIDKIRNNNTTGMFEAGQNIKIEQLTKDWAIEKAALSISAAFAKDDYTTAKAIVDDRVNAELEGLQDELDGLKFFYSENRSDLSDERKKLLEFEIAEVENEMATQKELTETIGALQLEAAGNGAPASVITAIGKAENQEDAIIAAGQYINLLERQREARLGREDGEEDNTIDIGPEDRRTLSGGGFTADEIDALPGMVDELGAQAVLEKYYADTRKFNALIKVLNFPANTAFFTESEIDELVTNEWAKEWLETKYQDDEQGLIDLARSSGFAGWWRSGGREKNLFLKSDKAREYVRDSRIQTARDNGLLLNPPQIGR